MFVKFIMFTTVPEKKVDDARGPRRWLQMLDDIGWRNGSNVGNIEEGIYSFWIKGRAADSTEGMSKQQDEAREMKKTSAMKRPIPTKRLPTVAGNPVLPIMINDLLT